MKQFTIYCTEEQCEKALKIGAPIEILPNYTEYGMFPFVKCADGNERPCVLPTAEQMLGWIESQGIFVDIDCNNDGYEYALWKDDGSFHNRIKYRLNLIENIREFENRREATLAAISSALEYLTNNKE